MFSLSRIAIDYQITSLRVFLGFVNATISIAASSDIYWASGHFHALSESFHLT